MALAMSSTAAPAWTAASKRRFRSADRTLSFAARTWWAAAQYRRSRSERSAEPSPLSPHGGQNRRAGLETSRAYDQPRLSRERNALRPAVRRYHYRLPLGVHRRCLTWRSSSGPTTPGSSPQSSNNALYFSPLRTVQQVIAASVNIRERPASAAV